MNKKFLSIVAASLCIFSIIGCGSKKDNKKETKSKSKVTTSTVKDDVKIDYYWTGTYKLKDGTGDLKVNKTDSKNMKFSISGKNNKNQEIVGVNNGTADLEEDFASYKYEDGSTISFCFVNGTGIDVKVYDKDSNEIFAGTYEQVQ